MNRRTLFIFLIAIILQPYAACGMNPGTPVNRGYRILDDDIKMYEQLFHTHGDWDWHPDDSQDIIQFYLDHAIGKTMSPAFVAKIIEKGANIQTPRHITPEWSMSPLAHAMRVMHAGKNLDHYFANIELLLERGAHFCDADKETFLLTNCLEQLNNRLRKSQNWEFEEKRSAQCIKRLIESGPFLIAPSEHDSPLYTALGMPSVVKYLLERGLKSREGMRGGNALQEARVGAHREIEERSKVARYRQCLALLEDNFRRKKLAQEIPALRINPQSRLSQLPPELFPLIGKYIAY